jgi:hypothetical protein
VSRGWPGYSRDDVRKESASTTEDDLRAEYDLGTLKGGVRGKYYRRVRTGTNLVLIEPDLAVAFPDGDSVNRALRLLLQAASVAIGRSRARTGTSRPRARVAGRKAGG